MDNTFTPCPSPVLNSGKNHVFSEISDPEIQILKCECEECRAADSFRLMKWRIKCKELSAKMDDLELQLAIMISKYLNK